MKTVSMLDFRNNAEKIIAQVTTVPLSYPEIDGNR
jgi:hypothetical protein